MSSQSPSDLLQVWNRRQDRAEEMVPIIGSLYRNQGVMTKIFGRPLVNQGAIELIKIHKFARHITGQELTVHDTHPILCGLTEIAPGGRLRIDVGKLAVRFKQEGGQRPVDEFLKDELSELDESRLPHDERPQDVVLYGFGRIGRLLARILIGKTAGGHGTRLAAVVVRPGSEGDLVKRASLLRRDSVHGQFSGTLSVDEERSCLIANGNEVHFIYATGPDQVDYTQYGIQDAIVIDNTGKWRDEDGLGLHLKSRGVKRVILTAPGKGSVPNIVYGINHDDIQEGQQILSAASCTTNAIVPALKVIQDRFGIAHGHIETCHSYTNDQNLLDNFHKKPRRGRGAPQNMVITETGAAKAVAKALPELAGRLSGNAIRVPTPNVSLAVLMLELEKPTTAQELNGHLRAQSMEGPHQLQIDYSASPDAVSSDFVGNGHASIIDAPATIVNGTHAVVYVWYDNEYGYSQQVVRLAERVSGLRPPTIPF